MAGVAAPHAAVAKLVGAAGPDVAYVRLLCDVANEVLGPARPTVRHTSPTAPLVYPCPSISPLFPSCSMQGPRADPLWLPTSQARARPATVPAARAAMARALNPQSLAPAPRSSQGDMATALGGRLRAEEVGWLDYGPQATKIKLEVCWQLLLASYALFSLLDLMSGC